MSDKISLIYKTHDVSVPIIAMLVIFWPNIFTYNKRWFIGCSRLIVVSPLARLYRPKVFIVTRDDVHFIMFNIIRSSPKFGE